MKIKTVIFDIGGVIFKNGVYSAYNKYPQFQRIFKEKYLTDCEIGKITDQALWLLLKKDLPGTDIGKLKEYIFSHFSFQKGVIDIARQLKNKGFKIAVLSNNLSEWVDFLFSQHNLFDFFGKENIVISADVGCRKPNPEIYLLTLKRLRIKAGEALFVDDLLDNIKAAQKLGIAGIQFKSINRLKNDLNIQGIL